MSGRLFFLLLIALPLSACRPADVPLPIAANTPVTIAAPETISAGDPLEISVSLAAPDETAVTLLFAGSYGPRLYQANTHDGQAIFSLAGSATRHAGKVVIIAAAGEARGQVEMEIWPGTAVAPVTPLVGARSIIADSRHWAMVIAVPHDRFGNPVAEGTPVDIRTQHPDGRMESGEHPVEHLLAWQRVWSGTVAGRSTVAAEVDGRFGPEKELLEIPGWPQPFTISVEPGPLIADGRRLVTVRSSVITDKFGNAMPDGTQVSFVVQGKRGPRVIPAQTLDGVAEAVLQAPDTAQTLTVSGSLFGVRSAPLNLSFTAGVQDVGTVLTRVDEAAGVVYLEAGPLLGTLDQFVPDGTAVRFVITGPDGQQQEVDGVSEAGLARVTLRMDGLVPGEYRVTAQVGGMSASGRFSLGQGARDE